MTIRGPIANPSLVATTFKITRSLRSRAQKVAEHYGTNVSAMIRDALLDYVRTHEALIQAEKDSKKPKEPLFERRLRALEDVSAPGKPSKPSEGEAASPPPASSFDAERDALFEKHAHRILAVINDPFDRRICLQEAVEEIQKLAPLSAPTIRQIENRLTDEVVKLRAEGQRIAEEQARASAPPPDPYQDVLDGKPVDFSKLKGPK